MALMTVLELHIFETTEKFKGPFPLAAVLNWDIHCITIASRSTSSTSAHWRSSLGLLCNSWSECRRRRRWRSTFRISTLSRGFFCRGSSRTCHFFRLFNGLGLLFWHGCRHASRICCYDNRSCCSVAGGLRVSRGRLFFRLRGCNRAGNYRSIANRSTGCIALKIGSVVDATADVVKVTLVPATPATAASPTGLGGAV